MGAVIKQAIARPVVPARRYRLNASSFAGNVSMNGFSFADNLSKNRVDCEHARF
jgi:hypothetical protein